MKRALIFRCLCLLMALAALTGCARTQPEETEPTAAQLSGDLVCLEISRFSGYFVEDPDNEDQVSSVAAILVANETDKFLDLATVTYTVGGKTATFQITGLPSGERVWVLEQDRLSIAEGDELVFEDCVVTYNENAMETTDDLLVQREGYGMTVTNRSGSTLKNVCVYYKNRTQDGAFLGGITYLVSFGDLAPGQSVRRYSYHLDETSHIVRYGYQT